jgi:hypothetical protein
MFEDDAIFLAAAILLAATQGTGKPHPATKEDIQCAVTNAQQLRDAVKEGQAEIKSKEEEEPVGLIDYEKV